MAELRSISDSVNPKDDHGMMLLVDDQGMVSEVVHRALDHQRLLIVEESAAIGRILTQHVEKWGIKSRIASSREDVFHQLAREPFDVVLIDFQLSDMDGVTLIREIRATNSGKNMPVLLMSSECLRSDDKRLLDVGIAAIVPKPVRPAQLLDAICRALGAQLHASEKSPVKPTLDHSLAERLPLQLLVADDNLINQKVARSIVRKLGYVADIAATGLEVLKAIEAKKYDVVFLDVQMPEMDGLEAARQIYQRIPGPERPRLIAMTGNAIEGDREKCLEAGMDDYISKPVRINELQTALEKWGPGRLHKKDDATPPGLADSLLDPAIIAELHTMQPENGISMMKELIDLFSESAPRSIAELGKSIHDVRQFAYHTHSLKSMGLNLGARRMVELCCKLEELGGSGNLDGAAQIVAQLQITFAQTETELRRHIRS